MWNALVAMVARLLAGGTSFFVLPLLLSPASPPFPFVALARLGPLSAPPAPPRLPAGSDGAYGMGEYVMYQQGLSMFKRASLQARGRIQGVWSQKVSYQIST